MEGNTLGVEAAEAIAGALKKHPEFQVIQLNIYESRFLFIIAFIRHMHLLQLFVTFLKHLGFALVFRVSFPCTRLHKHDQPFTKPEKNVFFFLFFSNFSKYEPDWLNFHQIQSGVRHIPWPLVWFFSWLLTKVFWMFLFQRALWSDMFTGRLKTEIPQALVRLQPFFIAKKNPKKLVHGF